jgi:uncharacterized protein YegL
MSNIVDIDRNKLVDTVTKTNVVMLLDTSGSMSWDGGINALNRDFPAFIETLQKDKYASACVDLTVYTFNHQCEKIIDKASVNDVDIPEFTANGGTDLDLAINKALDDVEESYQYYRDNKTKTKVSWVVLFTDADSNGQNIDKAVQRVNKMVDNEDILIFCIGTGNNIDIDQLKRFDPSKPIIYAPTGETLKPLFQWISKSISQYSQTSTGTRSKTEPVDRRYELY